MLHRESRRSRLLGDALRVARILGDERIRGQETRRRFAQRLWRQFLGALFLRLAQHDFHVIQGPEADDLHLEREHARIKRPFFLEDLFRLAFAGLDNQIPQFCRHLLVFLRISIFGLQLTKPGAQLKFLVQFRPDRGHHRPTFGHYFFGPHQFLGGALPVAAFRGVAYFCHRLFEFIELARRIKAPFFLTRLTQGIFRPGGNVADRQRRIGFLLLGHAFRRLRCPAAATGQHKQKNKTRNPGSNHGSVLRKLNGC